MSQLEDNKMFLIELCDEVEERMDEFGIEFVDAVVATAANHLLDTDDYEYLKEYCQERLEV